MSCLCHADFWLEPLPQDLINGNGATAEEKAMLDREFEDYRRNPEVGSPWKEVEARIRKSSRP